MSTDLHGDLQTEIELTRERYQRLLVKIPADIMPLPSKEPGWSNAEVLYRISISPLFIRSVIKRNSASWSHLLLNRSVTGTLIDWGNEMSIRAAVRHVTLLSLAKEYEYNCRLVLDMLESVKRDEFSKQVSLPEPNSLLYSQTTIEQLFHYVKNYFLRYRKSVEFGNGPSEKD